MKTKSIIPKVMAAVALLALAIPMPAFSQMSEPGQLEMMGDMMGMCMQHAEKMGLSDDQISKMKPAHSEMQKKQARYKADQKIAEIELREILDVKDFDLEKAASAAKKIAKIKTDFQLELLKGMKEMRTLLTDEQFKNMNKMMSMKHGDKRHSKKMIKK